MNIVDGIDGTNGIGIINNIIEYAVSSSGTDIPGGPISDEYGNILFDNQGYLNINSWHEEIPPVSPGEFLWTRTTTFYSDGTRGVSYSVARNGQNPYTVVLSNESHTFAASTNAAIEGTTVCDIIAYDGQEALSVSVGEITGIPKGMSVEIQGNNSKNAKFYVSVTEDMVTQNGTLTIPIRINEFEFIKFFTYSLALAGESSVAYQLRLSAAAISRTENGFYNPPTITATATEQVGSGSIEPYLGRFKIETTLDNVNWTESYVSEIDESYKLYAMPSDILALKVTLYRADGFDEILDYQTVPIVNDGTTGIGIIQTLKEYAISDSGTILPGGPYTDGDNYFLFDDVGGFSNSVWLSEMPENVPDGMYLWTKITFKFSDETEEIVYNISHYAKDGVDGVDGIHVVRFVEQYYVSSSKLELVDGNWSYISPAPDEIPSGRFVWKRLESLMSDGSILYSDPVYESTISGMIYDVKYTKGLIESKIWQTDFINTLDEYDGSVTQSIRDRVNETITDIDGIHTTISDMESRVFGDGSESVVKRIQSVKETADEHTRIISEDILGDQSSSIKTIAQQAADHFSWLVTNSSTATDTSFELSERVAELVAENINAKGLVTFSGLDTNTQKKIDDSQKILTEMKGGIVSTKIEYSQSGNGENPPGGLLKDEDGNVIYDVDGHPFVDGTWSKKLPEVQPGSFLWVKTTTIYLNGDEDVNYVAIKSGEDGLSGKDGKNPVSIVPYWFLGVATPRSTPLTYAADWSLTPPAYKEDMYYWECEVTTYDDGSKTCTDPILNNAYNEAIQNSKEAILLANRSIELFDIYSPFIANAETILQKWTGDATLEKTTIDGGWIDTNTITSEHLATNAIMSRNYAPGNLINNQMIFSGRGSFLDLENGNFYTPNFSVNANKAYLNGEIRAVSGQIGDEENSYWNIGTEYDEEWEGYASLTSVGDARIQTGNLTLSTDSLNTLNNWQYLHYTESGKDVWYDYGLRTPDRNLGNGDLDYPLKSNFLYIRKIGTQPTKNTLESEWEYIFRVDKDGNIYDANGENLSGKLPLSGGTITGNLTVNGTLDATAKFATQLNHKLTINNEEFDGSKDLSITVSTQNVVAGAGISIDSSGNDRIIRHSNNITAGTVKGTETKTLANGDSFSIPTITYDSQGHITTVGTTTLTLPTINTHKDDQGQDVSTDYVQTFGNQSITGTKTFQNNTRFVSGSASTSKSTGAVQIEGGLGVSKQVNAESFRVNEHVMLEYDSNLQCLNFKFA